MSSSHARKRKITIFSNCCGWQSCLTRHYITLMLLQCIIFMPKNNDSSKFPYLPLREDNSCFYKIITSWITAAYYFEIPSPIYERNEHFESFKMMRNLKFCHIPFNFIDWFLRPTRYIYMIQQYETINMTPSYNWHIGNILMLLDYWFYCYVNV